MSETPQNAADLIISAREKFGLSIKDVAESLGRSPRMIRKVLSGESSGAAYVEALQYLNVKGTVREAPERRRNKAGKLVPVRVHESDADKAKRIAEGVEKAPTAVPGFKPPARFGHKVIYGRDGNRIYESVMKPGSKPSQQRFSKQLVSDLRSIAKSQRTKDKRISFSMRTSDGQEINIGMKSGYFSSDVLARVKNEFGGDVNAFLVDQINKTNRYKLKPGASITDIRMNVTDARGQAQNSRK
ncbi:MAG: hypothetical protein LBE25_09315 [Arthrobacter sp.]|jgi:transcriptional regulator with XRE-family HTH domain|nr:hypothetical protein [Arthrobacter sp.]